MSCYQVDDEHIHVLIHAALTYARTGNVGHFSLPTDQPEGAPGVIRWLDGTTRLVLSEATADRVGQMLRDANTACINDKYAEDAAYVYAHRRPRFTTWTPLEILHAINGYRYQSDESPSWPTSPAGFLPDARSRHDPKPPRLRRGPVDHRRSEHPGRTCSLVLASRRPLERRGEGDAFPSHSPAVA